MEKEYGKQSALKYPDKMMQIAKKLAVLKSKTQIEKAFKNVA